MYRQRGLIFICLSRISVSILNSYITNDLYIHACAHMMVMLMPMLLLLLLLLNDGEEEEGTEEEEGKGRISE